MCVCVERERERKFKRIKNGDLCVERERGRQFFYKKKWRLEYIYIYTSRKFVQYTGKAIENEI